MDQSTISIVISVIALLVAIVTFFQVKNAPETENDSSNFSTKPLQLQAYERLVILCERISLPNLISRLSQPGLSAGEMHVLLIETIRQEYDYNASQQVYVSTAAWDAVRNLRDQNTLIVNTIAKTLPAEAKAADLNRKLLEGMMQEQNAALHTIALETLNREAKKLMK